MSVFETVSAFGGTRSGVKQVAIGLFGLLEKEWTSNLDGQ